MLIVAILALASADHGECMGNLWGIYGDMGYVWGTYGEAVGSLWGIYGASMGGLRTSKVVLCICHARVFADMSCNLHGMVGRYVMHYSFD